MKNFFLASILAACFTVGDYGLVCKEAPKTWCAYELNISGGYNLIACFPTRSEALEAADLS